ncbi:MAG: endonuclease domain-containing protein [Phycisphaerales bacterium]|nr:endonuclease domain-containing protein [Phycisphaerales bacterium]
MPPAERSDGPASGPLSRPRRERAGVRASSSTPSPSPTPPPPTSSSPSGPLSRPRRERAGERASSSTPSPSPTPPPPTPLSTALTPSYTSKIRALDLRHNTTTPERILWSRLRAGKCFGIKFRRQHPLGEYSADFYCHDAALVVEVDGLIHGHQQAHDRQRDGWMRSRGLEVLRIPASRVTEDVDHVVDRIVILVERRMEALHPGRFTEKKREFLQERAEKSGKKKEPSPQPSPAGGGRGGRTAPAARARKE